ncbi:MAG: secretion protein HlyD [Planctomycetota bacterium]
MKKKPFIVVGLILAVGAGIGIWKTRQAPSLLDGGDLTLYGNVDIRRVSLAFRVGGRLTEVRFEEGDRLEAGDVVALLDAEPFEQDLARAQGECDLAAADLARLKNGTRPQEIEQARARVRASEAALQTIKLEYDRRSELVTSGAVTGQSVDDITARRAQAEAEVQIAQAALALALEGPRQEDIEVGQARWMVAQAALAQARIRVRDATLLAPNGGILLTRVEEPGAVVGMGQTVGMLSLTDPVWVRAYVAEPDLGRIRPGMKAQIITDSQPDHPYPGHVGFISPEAEFTPKNVQTPQLRTDLVFRVRIVADNPDEGLRQGMPVTVHLDTTETP